VRSLARKGDRACSGNVLRDHHVGHDEELSTEAFVRSKKLVVDHDESKNSDEHEELNQIHSNDAKAPVRIKKRKLAKELPRD
jgi:hypothetical protein